MVSLASILGFASVVCWCLLGIPQLIENYHRQDTAGLSLPMFLLWAMGGFLVDAYLLYEHQDISLLIQWNIMAFECVLVCTQIFAYEIFKSTESWYMRWSQAVSVTFIICLFFGGLHVGSWQLYLIVGTETPSIPIIFGSLVPTIILLGGFIPQFIESFRSKDAEAYSTGLSLLDSSGCVLASVALLLDSGPLIALAPYAAVFLFQYCLLGMKYWYRWNKTGQDAVDLGLPVVVVVPIINIVKFEKP